MCVIPPSLSRTPGSSCDFRLQKNRFWRRYTGLDNHLLGEFMSSTRKTWADKMVGDALNDPAPLLRELDAENDELAVRERLAGGRYNTWQSRVVEEWLRRKSDVLQEEAAARAEETLSIARKANRLASEANSIARRQAADAARSSKYAMYAAIVATTAAVAANKDAILSLIFNP